MSAMLETLKDRFEKNRTRHPGLRREQVEARLKGKEKVPAALLAMEESGGEPDVVGLAEDGAAV